MPFTMTSQQTTAGPTAGQPSQVMHAPAPTTPNETQGQICKKRTLRGLAIAEIVLGVVTVFTGIILVILIGSGSVYGRDGYRYYFTTGEGIWGGVWVIVAGALGVSFSKPHVNICLINTHVTFCIVGAVFSAPVFALSVVGTQLVKNGVGILLFSIVCFTSFSSLVILIITAAYCYALQGCCSSQPCQGYIYGPQMAFVANPQQQVTHPGATTFQQVYLIQGQVYQPVPATPVSAVGNQPGFVQPSQDQINPSTQKNGLPNHQKQQQDQRNLVEAEVPLPPDYDKIGEMETN